MSELETERNELHKKVRSMKAEIVELKSSQTRYDEDNFRLKAEIEELVMRNERM